MKKLLLIPVFIVLFSVLVNAKCGDKFCDPDENCKSCSSDCLCTLSTMSCRGCTNKVGYTPCCPDFNCTDCEEGRCFNGVCSSLKFLASMFKKVECNSDGSISLHIELITLDKYIRSNHIKVFMKQNNPQNSFKEINGKWKSKDYNPSYRNVLEEEAFFTSDLGVFDKKGEYWVRVKFQKEHTDILYDDYLISCPEIIKEPEIEEEIVEEPEPTPEPEPEITPEPEENITLPEENITSQEGPVKKEYITMNGNTGIFIMVCVALLVSIIGFFLLGRE